MAGARVPAAIHDKRYLRGIFSSLLTSSTLERMRWLTMSKASACYLAASSDSSRMSSSACLKAALPMASLGCVLKEDAPSP